MSTRIPLRQAACRFPLAPPAVRPDGARVFTVMENQWKRAANLVCCLAALALVATNARAQIPVPTAAKEGKSAPASDTSVLQKIVSEATAALPALDGENDDPALPAGIPLGEKEALHRQLEETTLTGSRALKIISAVAEARKAADSAKAETSAWKGFDGGPPRSLLVVDGLLDERDALKEVLASQWSALANYKNLLDPVKEDAKSAERAREKAFQSAADATGTAADAAKWRYDAAKAGVSFAATRVLLLQGNIDLYQARIDAGNAEVALLERKAARAKTSAVLEESDIARIQAVVDSRKEEYGKMAAGASRRLKTILSRRAAAQKELAALQAKGDAEKEAATSAKVKLESLAAQADLLERMRDTAQTMAPVQDEWVNAYRARWELLKNPRQASRAGSLGSLRGMLERLGAWERVIHDELEGNQAEISRLDTQLASLPAAETAHAVVAERRGVVAERLEQLKTMEGTLVSMRRLLARWVADFTGDGADAGFMARVRTLGSSFFNRVENIWSYEITSFDTSRMIGGVLVADKSALTVATVVKAVLFFLLTYLIAVKIANRVQIGVVRRGRLAEAHARTLRNWAMIVVCVALAISTLKILKIPLTVFAFFGGALAIGLGFGTQNLIKNFISGIILLVERRVRVGDLITVGQITGRVVEVSTRSSVVADADGKETLIPNSLFLENEVTNLTYSSRQVRRTVRVGVAYGSSVTQVTGALAECVARHGLVLKKPEPIVAFEDFGDNALIFAVYYWTDTGENPVVIASDVRTMIEKRFGELGISFPFPQRDMHLMTSDPIEVAIRP